jgi:hypothetical protein
VEKNLSQHCRQQTTVFKINIKKKGAKHLLKANSDKQTQTFSTFSFLKPSCKFLKLFMYSCSSLVSNLTFFIRIEPTMQFEFLFWKFKNIMASKTEARPLGWSLFVCDFEKFS